MARQAQSAQQRIPFFCYIDEFHYFITPSMAAILSGARKYGLGLVLAHQDMQQVAKSDADIAASILSNSGTRICFRLGDADAKRLEDGFASFSADDLQNLNTGEAIARVNTVDADFNIEVIRFEGMETDCTDAIIAHARSAYSIPIQQTDTQEPIKEQPNEPVVIPKAQENQAEPNNEQVREHRYLQTFIKKMAEEYGYKATLEVPTSDGSGFVDVALEKDGNRIAVEISITTSAEWELHNIEKCLAAGYAKVVVCSSNGAKRAAIEQRINTSVPKRDQDKISVIGPEDISSLFNESRDTEPSTTMMKGYRVKVQYDNSGADKQAILKSILVTKKP
jgi:hypothetical protein